jgi:hypothetical protein
MALTKIPGNLIETGAITGDVLADGGIATAKLADDAVTTDKILDANITHAKLHETMDLTGKTVTVATAAGSTNTTAAASTAFVQQELTTLIGGAPGTLDTLNELAAAINDDSNYNTTLTTALATKLPLAGGTMTGSLIVNSGSSTVASIQLNGGANSAANDNSSIFSKYSLVLNADSTNAISGRTINLRNGGTDKLVVSDTAITTTIPMYVVGASSVRNSIVANLTLDGGTLVQNPYDGFGFGINFTGRDYGNAVRNYAHIYSIIEDQSSSSGGGDAGFESLLSFSTNSGGASDTNPTEKMRITSAGNVGIGVTNPGQTLEIHNSDASDYTDFALRGTGHKYVIGVGNHSVATVNDKWYLYDNDNTAFRMVVDTSGNVGIGTTDPQGVLHVAQSRGSAGDLWTQVGAGNTPSIHIQNTANTANVNAALYFRNSSGEKASIGARFVNQSTGQSELRFSVTNSSGTTRERMILSGDGNVGIGTSDPDTLLELRKDTDSSGYGEYPTLSLRNDNAAGYSAIHFQEGSTQRARVEVGNNSGTPYMGLYTTSAASGIMIKGGGNVGIGTTTNISSPLTVQTNGGANSVSIIGRNNGVNDEAVISFYEYDGTTRNAYIIKEAGDLAFATGSGGSAVEKLRVASDGTVIITNHGGSANKGVLQLSTQAATYQLLGGNNLGYLGYKTGGYHRWFGSDDVEEMRLSDDTLTIPGHATNGTVPLILGNTGITQYTDLIIKSNSGNGEIFKAGTGYTDWGGAAALNIYNSNEKIAFHPSGQANVVQMTSAGIVMGAGKGISFGNNANYSGMSSEILDDYEEGTWTPTLGSEAVAGSGASINYNNKYVKIGRLVHVTGWFNTFTFSTITSGTYVMLRGLPFRPEHHSTGFTFRYTTASLAGGTYGYGHTSMYACYLLVGGSTGAAVHLTRAAIGAPSSATTHFMFDGTYYTDD